MMHIKHVFALLLICLVVYSCGGSKKATTSKDKTDVVAMGGKIFSQNCQGCHSAKNGTTYGAAPNLATISLDKSELLKVITKGRGRMPAFDARLSSADIQNVSDYILSLREQ